MVLNLYVREKFLIFKSTQAQEEYMKLKKGLACIEGVSLGSLIGLKACLLREEVPIKLNQNSVAEQFHSLIDFIINNHINYGVYGYWSMSMSQMA